MNFFIAKLLSLSIISFSFFSVSNYAQNKPDILTKKFVGIGYEVKSKESKIPTKWDKEQFQMLSKQVYKIKRQKPMKGDWNNVYPRFEVVEEVYENEEKAETRNRRIAEKPPNLPVEREEYWMVSGFQHGKKVYFISTDAIVFYEMMDEFIEKFQSAIKE